MLRDMETINTRRTIRKYSDKDVSEELLGQLLSQAARTQTMGNLQLYSVVVTRSKEGKEKLARMAERVWNVKGDIVEQTAALGIDALEAFIKEIGLPTRWSELGITDESVLRAAADTCLLMPGCCKQFTRDELFEVLKECK